MDPLKYSTHPCTAYACLTRLVFCVTVLAMTKQRVYFTTSQVAERYQVDASTVRRWVLKGQLLPAITTPGGHHRFSADSLPASVPNDQPANSKPVTA